MDVKRIIRERRLQEAAEEIRRQQAFAPYESAKALAPYQSAQSQPGSAARRASRQISARSSRPPSQFGD